MTWSGRLLVANSIIFILTSIDSQSIFVSELETLHKFGAQDPVSLVNGDYWRYFTPMFLHGGLIHYIFNSVAIYYIGRDLEPILSQKWFLPIYLLAGLGGSVASAIFSTTLSVGASGAIFGLLGSGLYIEFSVSKYIQTTTGTKPKRGPYLSLLIINLPLSFLPMIDSSAHFGGFIVGFLSTYALMRIRPNRIVKMNKALGGGALLSIVLFIVYGAQLGMDQTFISSRLIEKAEMSDSLQQKVYLYDQILSIDSNSSEIYFKRGEILIKNGYPTDAILDFQRANIDGRFTQNLILLRGELIKTGKVTEAQILDRLIQESKPYDF